MNATVPSPASPPAAPPILGVPAASANQPGAAPVASPAPQPVPSVPVAPIPPVAAPPLSAPAPDAEDTVWPRSAQAAAALLVLLALVLIACHAYLSGRWATRPSRIQHSQQRSADSSLDRGEEENSVEPVVLKLSRNPLKGPNVLPPVVGKSQKMSPGDEPIDLNQASAQELLRLPGIGQTIAQRIVDRRKIEPFQQVEDLRKVSGIGAKTLEKLRPLVRVNSSPDTAPSP